ncbi:hypothetical protein DFH94DRAFT_690455 [Russula ochroleuca]|jgi:hypothetical protein|uniref:Uncharacterized protein n=1 Tax=Russula ochroleuca TaxID=152965 RepID=A0A9P5TBQ3_9AGAM|nr:hypothetical protein DFH94DRAFT_690455 [Russula ochroleuca]
MRATILTSLFFALFALFSVALAVPVAPQGAVSKRQGCQMGACKDATPAAPGSDSGSTIPPSTILELITNLIGLISPDSVQPPAAASTPSPSAA